MKKATILLLRFGRIAGYIPFYYIPTTETFQLKKCSFQTVYFLGVLSFSTLWTLLYLYVFIHRLLNSSASVALAFTSWVIGSISMTLIFLSFWIYKHEITHQIRQLFTWWNQIQDCIYKRRSEKYAKIIISIWIITALIQMISMTILQLEHPGAVGFLSSHFAFGNTTIIPNWIHYTSVSLHLVMLVYDRKTTGLLTTGLLTTGHVTTGLLDNWSFGQLVFLTTGLLDNWSFRQLVFWTTGLLPNWSRRPVPKRPVV